MLRKGSANFGWMLFMVSLAANLVMGVMLAGCLSNKAADPQPRPTSDASLSQLKDVAERLGVGVDAKSEAIDVATAIRVLLNDAEVKVPSLLSDSASRASLAILNKNDKELLLKQKAFLESLQGKRVLVIPQKRMIPSAVSSESVK